MCDIEAGRREADRSEAAQNEAACSAAYSAAHLARYGVEYFAGIELFNQGEFHAAHDAWEEMWLGPVSADEKLFLQALIQAAVAFHHLDIGRPGAARRMYVMAKEKFGRLGTDVFMSLEIPEFVRQLDLALSWLESGPDPREIIPPDFPLPVIQLVPCE